MRVVQGVHDRNFPTGLFFALECPGDRGGAGVDVGIGDMADLGGRLTLEDAPQIGIAHRRQRMIAHAALVQRHAVHEKMALIDRTPGGRKGGAGDGEGGAEAP